MNSIRAEADKYISNETTRKKFMNFYQCAKTISLLNSLYTSFAINKSVYDEELLVVQDVYQRLKNQLGGYDLQRFCQLWEIEYHQLKEEKKDLIQYPIKIGNMLPQVNEAIHMAQTYGQIYEVLSSFCQLIQNIKGNQTMQQIIEQLDNKSKAMVNNKLGDKLPQPEKDALFQLLTKFKVEFQRIYRL